MNRNDVIYHLQIIRTWAAVGKDPIYNGIEPKCCEDVERWIDEALELLKEQEPVKSIKSKLSFTHGFNWDIWDCGCCGNQLRSFAKYCDQCGRAVKWDDY